MGVRTNDESEPAGGAAGAAPGAGPGRAGEPAPDVAAASPAPDVAAAAVMAEAVHPRTAAADADSEGSSGTGTGSGDSDRRPEVHTADGLHAPEAETPPAPKAPSRRPPSLTRDTARPEGGGRAAPGDASAPARQWPLLTVLALAGLGLVVVGTDAFADAFRVGTILIGVALITGAVLRRILPSVGMLAVRSRFTDMVTYGLLGTVIVLIALVTQPNPWLDVPFLEDAVHFTVR
ncbi:DUF3017 domain-containing protein [Streptomyces sp. NBC_01481]|uniref:DUF3017 domain-containing protein n=1 Tax=Streptomyces sp. NBC_01481 TaxID=2975869 RepID=UPI002255158E|nr:DUF3017 domain-containing protein [Streptomyces sp. NBC_01481]MCX4586491.1 DUF3017 domain-containing protein [Streptomyces sp. NBC_01481]